MKYVPEIHLKYIVENNNNDNTSNSDEKDNINSDENYSDENDKNYNDLHEYCVYIINTLLFNGMIKNNEHYVLNMKYVKLKKMGIVDDLVKIMEEISDNPNIINEGRWVAASKSDKKENTCMPCKSKHYFLYPFTI